MGVKGLCKIRGSSVAIKWIGELFCGSRLFHYWWSRALQVSLTLLDYLIVKFKAMLYFDPDSPS